jgi:hypothetical protein
VFHGAYFWARAFRGQASIARLPQRCLKIS